MERSAYAHTEEDGERSTMEGAPFSSYASNPYGVDPSSASAPLRPKVHRWRWFFGGLLSGLLAAGALVVGFSLAAYHADPVRFRDNPVVSIFAGVPTLDDDQYGQTEAALSQALSVADRVAALNEEAASACVDPSGDEYSDRIAAAREELRNEIEEDIARIEKAKKAASEAREVLAGSDEGAEYERCERALEAMEGALGYERALLVAQRDLGTVPQGSSASTQTPDYFQPAWDASLAFDKIDVPVRFADLHDRYVSLWAPLATYLYEAHETNGADSPVELHSMREVLDWARRNESAALYGLHSGMAQHLRFTSHMLSGSVEDGGAPQVAWKAIERISPNLYPSLGSVLDLSIATTDACSVRVEAQIEGFSQKLDTLVRLEPGMNFVRLKPQLIPDLAAANLENGRTAQLDFKVSTESGDVIEQQSASVELLSLYDFNWRNDEFGTTSQLDLLAWLRPAQPQIDELSRRAAEYMGEWTDGMFAEIAGYQYSDDWYGTLLQVAAIQKSVSDTGMRYVVDTYSPRADQRILTPQATLDKKQALCVETSLVVASALTSAGMHPYIIITPGHSQVAVESWEGSGGYFLIETSLLPYDGVNRSLDIESPDFYAGLVPYLEDEGGIYTSLDGLGSAEVWNRFFAGSEDGSDAYGGVYVIDCNLQRTFSLHGLDSM
ncbi:MAG: hypothetical protein IJ131_00690 [Eggerthellaceae bacterium]|nr:hypothetical protein [Eggerthellaceae bacterium]